LQANFDDSNCKFKEKEMVAFRRVITALAVLALFTGLASAQVGGSGQSQLTCSTNVAVTPQLRGEGFTEQTGDITISCTGGSAIAAGNPIPQVNITVFYNSTVTSRLLTNAAANATNAPNEALLLIDEPGSGLPGYGPSLAQVLCTTPLIGCAASVGTVAGPTFNTAVVPGTSTPAPNVYEGVVPVNSTNNRAVTFFGIPVLPPTTTGLRVFRITNVRIDATPLIGGAASGASAVQANIAISGATSLAISNSAPIVGYVSAGLSASASGSTSLNQCSTQTKTSVNTLTFTENFGTAFKTRVVAQSNNLYAGQLGSLPQNTPPYPNNNGNQAVPGAIYNSESNFVFPVTTANSSGTAGLADFGTRLKATFNNIPSAAHVWVSTSNVNNNAFPVTAPTPVGGSNGNAAGSGTYVGYAVLINGENTSDGSTAPGSGFLPTIAATDNGPNNGNVPIAEVSIVNGSGAAVWEVVNTNPNTSESLKFAVYISYSANVAQNSPLPGASTVNLSFAPTATSGVNLQSLSVPRFAADSNAARNIFSINICRTVLLYPYITNQAGFDTGLTVANTSIDPLGASGASVAAAQAGSCKFTYYGGTTAAPTTPPAATDTGNIAAGTVYANTLSAIAPNFQGYMFAVCNFQYAHGFAFISDTGARNLAMGYLALIIPDPGTVSNGTRNASPPCQGISGCVNSGEQSSH